MDIFLSERTKIHIDQEASDNRYTQVNRVRAWMRT